MTADIRWEQRFSNYNRALQKLTEGVEFANKSIAQEGGIPEDMLREAVIQRFEYTHELAWKVMKDYAQFQGFQNIAGSRDATRKAFEMGLIENGDVWMEMIPSRNETTHTYNEDKVEAIYRQIVEGYHPAFKQFKETMEKYLDGATG